MALKYTGTGVFKYGLDVRGLIPLDCRNVVANASDLTNFKTLFVSADVPTWYVGMQVFAEDTKKLYVLQSEVDGFKPVGADENQLSNYVTTETLNNKLDDINNELNIIDNTVSQHLDIIDDLYETLMSGNTNILDFKGFVEIESVQGGTQESGNDIYFNLTNKQFVIKLDLNYYISWEGSQLYQTYDFLSGITTVNDDALFRYDNIYKWDGENLIDIFGNSKYLNEVIDAKDNNDIKINLDNNNKNIYIYDLTESNNISFLCNNNKSNISYNIILRIKNSIPKLESNNRILFKKQDDITLNSTCIISIKHFKFLIPGVGFSHIFTGNLINLTNSSEDISYELLNNYKTDVLDKEYIKSSDLTKIYTYKGSVDNFSDLNDKTPQEGDVYNIINDFTIDGKSYLSGTNVAWVALSETESGHWDALGGSITNASGGSASITENIKIVGGPLADAVKENWPEDWVDDDEDKIIPKGTTFLKAMETLFYKVKLGFVLWDNPVWTLTMNKPSLTVKNGNTTISDNTTLEVGTLLSITAAATKEYKSNIITAKLDFDKECGYYYGGTRRFDDWNYSKYGNANNNNNAIETTIYVEDTELERNSYNVTEDSFTIKCVQWASSHSTTRGTLDSYTVYASDNFGNRIESISSSINNDGVPTEKAPDADTSTSIKVIGAYKVFYGGFVSDDDSNYNNIRTLSSSFYNSAGGEVTIDPPNGGYMHLLIAIPNKPNITIKAYNIDNSNADITGSFEKKLGGATIKDAGGNNVSYNIWEFKPDIPWENNKIKITYK